MKKDPILLPKGKCLNLLSQLAVMGKQAENAWFFVHSNVIEELQKSDYFFDEEGRKSGTLVFTLRTTQSQIVIDITALNTDWKPILSISDPDISFTLMPCDPEELFFFKMKE